MNEALAISERVGGYGAKIQAAILVLIPAGVIAAIGAKFHFSIQQWLFCPGGLFLLWIMFLMLIAAFKKHKKQETIIAAWELTATPKLEIRGITFRRSMQGGDSCRVVIHNPSETTKAENVSVRVSGIVQYKDIFVEGYDPFHESDLIPSSGHRDINPKSTADFNFPNDLNHMIHIIRNRSGSFRPAENQKQTLKFEASSSNSIPASVEFIVNVEQWDKVAFEKRTPDVENENKSKSLKTKEIISE